MSKKLLIYGLLVILFPIFIGASKKSPNSNERLKKESVKAKPTNTSKSSASKSPEYVPGQIIVKLRGDIKTKTIQKKSDKLSTGIPSVDAKIAKWNIKEIKKIFPHKTPPTNPVIPDLSRIYQLNFSAEQDVMEIIDDFSTDNNIEYAEPRYFHYTNADVNDPLYPQQLHLPQVKADSAWDISQGDRSVIISIIDTGVDWDHEDLAANIWSNANEAIGDANGDGFPGIQGVDDDGDGLIDEDSQGLQPGELGYTNDLADDDDENGFVDDVRGWDFVDVPLEWEPNDQPVPGEDGRDEDNDPSDFDGHGTHCAGIASAVTNNKIGGAGIGWNCTIMPVRVGYVPVGGTGGIRWGYEGIVYATDNGADIISLSWGGSGYSQYAQEVINYAFASGTVVVAAAGNDDSQALHYPSAYDNAIAVAYTISYYDQKAGDSNYGTWVDICAPGTNVLSTVPNNQYDRKAGSSMACPLVAGTAGLVKSLHPDWDNQHIAIHLGETADNIDDLNPNYAGLLGRGRVNAYRALLENPPSVQMLAYTIDDSTNG
ncbi:MAG: S8 family serine peptidase, partial [bacterium]